MPFYDVQHVCPLSPEKQERLAKAITKIHSELFHTPSFFVNVAFTDVGSRTMYAGGLLESGTTSHILAHVRQGGNRTKSDSDKLASKLHAAWTKTLDPSVPTTDLPSAKNPFNLPPINVTPTTASKTPSADPVNKCTVFVLSDIAAGVEAGFLLPPAGEDERWMKENLEIFSGLSEKGDPRFTSLLEEIKDRFRYVVPGEGRKLYDGI